MRDVPDWQPISTAPRDGTEVELTNDPVDGEVWTMRWLPRVSIWAMVSFMGSVLSTWDEADAECAPLWWRRRNG